ncbi:ATP-binding cassette domain-containing protein [Gordonia paraffinivorans]|uniref:ATP-binding cassette domain-containing protein n=1 Tax=Gordonia paraffinivorans TaxID=175628 RepID=UPI0022A93402
MVNPGNVSVDWDADSDEVAAKLRRWRLENQQRKTATTVAGLPAEHDGPSVLADVGGSNAGSEAQDQHSKVTLGPARALPHDHEESATQRCVAETPTRRSPDSQCAGRDNAAPVSSPCSTQIDRGGSVGRAAWGPSGGTRVLGESSNGGHVLAHTVAGRRAVVSEPDPRLGEGAVISGSEASPAIRAQSLHKRFKGTVAVADVSFSVPAGKIVALLGPNGAGKTTTVNMLCTLLKPDGGYATVDGHDVVHDAAAVRRSIMLTGQFAALDESLTGRENLILFGRLLGLSKPAAKKRADELLEIFSLTDAARKRVRQYSGGMRRRIDIACGLVTSPKVVFLDEPTTGLDPRSRLEVWALVGRLRDEGVTILLTTQYLEEADVLSDDIVVIDQGRVIAQGTADELKEATGAAYCEVTPADIGDLDQLLGILSDLIPGGSVRTDDHVIAVPAPRGTETLVEVIRRTSDAGIKLSDVAMRRPSLDEVFLALTDPTQNGR